MYPVVLQTEWFNVYSYGLLLAIGYLVATLWVLYEAKIDNLPTDPIFDLLIFQLIVGILGARLLFLVEYYPQKILSISEILALSSGGLTLYGGIISSFIFNYLFCLYKKLPFWRVMDCIGLALPLGISIARWGCFLNGCCYGKESMLPWCVEFRFTYGKTVHPTQVYESIATFIIFIFLQKIKNSRKAYGHTFLNAIIFYSFARFFIEFYRGDNEIILFGLTFSQAIGIVLILLSFTTKVYLAKNSEKSNLE